MADLQWASEDLVKKLVEAAHEWDDVAAWARTFATLLESSTERHSALRDVVVATIRMVMPVGTDVYDLLWCLLMQIREVVTHGIWHGAVGTLAASHLYLCHTTDLREVVPGFPVTSEIPGGINVHRSIAEFSNYAEAIVAVVDVESVIKDAPLRNRLCSPL